MNRQPVHTFYGGAHLFKADVAAKLGRLALGAFQEHALRPSELADIFGWTDAALAEKITARVLAKLLAEPVEDYRIDFEDGFGVRSDEEEDGEAKRAAAELAAGLERGTLPPAIGIRIKPLSAELRQRAEKTLTLFLTELAAQSKRRLPSNFVVTLPKVENVEEPQRLAAILLRLEKKLRLPLKGIKVELMIESPQGLAAAARLVQAARGRCSGVPFGPYDYAASLGIASSAQRLDHPACDFARQTALVALTPLGVPLADGPTNRLPIGDAPSVREGWRLHYANVRRALETGIYQGWDVHPAQLPSRYLAVYAFFLEGAPAAKERLAAFRGRSNQAVRTRETFDDAATGRVLANFLERGLACGALAKDEVPG